MKDGRYPDPLQHVAVFTSDLVGCDENGDVLRGQCITLFLQNVPYDVHDGVNPVLRVPLLNDAEWLGVRGVVDKQRGYPLRLHRL